MHSPVGGVLAPSVDPGVETSDRSDLFETGRRIRRWEGDSGLSGLSGLVEPVTVSSGGGRVSLGLGNVSTSRNIAGLGGFECWSVRLLLLKDPVEEPDDAWVDTTVLRLH